jgi:hypothetical protein
MRRFHVQMGFIRPPSYGVTVEAASVVEAIKIAMNQAKLEGFGTAIKTSVKEVPCENPA